MPPIPRCLLTTTDPDALGRVESMEPRVVALGI
jgi:hypothetical protein